MELVAAAVGICVGLTVLYKALVSPVLRDRVAAWEEIKELKAEVKRLKGGG